MSTTIPVKSMLAAFLAATFAMPLAAQPPLTQSYLEYRGRMQSDADEFLFFEDDRKQVVSYNSDRVVRVCTKDSPLVTPMRIEFDDKMAMLAPGDCIRVEAMEVYLEPSETLQRNTFLEVEVDTLN
ncbi:hypothetical protein [Pseudohongiella sp.]|uniref:Uncharacterized protein n=1 Tax=marine sediment metagenome TaxID=412755 RepID=A0A0F9YFF4_9ZZZZ|nr:hypothetical protein [Pseudohongiella sp.]HDZ08293.1 hypothetical protein [Pseudohongiella sp.]HEA62569.1 hypothetical protein [Pseudohongiella sp.]